MMHDQPEPTGAKVLVTFSRPTQACRAILKAYTSRCRGDVLASYEGGRKEFSEALYRARTCGATLVVARVGCADHDPAEVVSSGVPIVFAEIGTTGTEVGALVPSILLMIRAYRPQVFA